MIFWAAVTGACAGCLLMIAFGNAPLGTLVPCAYICHVAFG